MCLSKNARKRGPKPYNPFSNRLMPIPLIASRLGISPRTVHYDLNHAMRKMRAAGFALLTSEMGSIDFDSEVL